MTGARVPRVLHLTWRLSVGGGIQAVIRALVSQASSDFELHVATVRPALAEDRLDDLARHAHIHPLGYLGRLGLLQRLGAAFGLRAVAREVRPQLLHAHSGTALYTVPAALLVPQGARLLDVHDAPGNQRHSRPTEWAEGLLCRRMGFVPIAHSTSVATEVAQRWRLRPDRVELVPLGIDTTTFTVSPRSSERWRCAYGLGDADLVVLYVARLVASKNIDLFIDVAASIHPLHPRAVFVVVAGGERARLDRRIEAEGLVDVVRLVGPCDGPDLAAAYQAADVFLSTSDYEGFGLAVTEAMASGVPVVATRVGGVTDVVSEGVTGLLAERGDRAGLANAVARLLGDADLRARLGAAGHLRARERFDVSTMVRGYERVYRRRAPRREVVVLKSQPYGGRGPTVGERGEPQRLPYRIDWLVSGQRHLRWTDRHLGPPWTAGPVRALVRFGERAAAPWLQTTMLLPAIRRSSAVLAMFESEGHFLAWLRRFRVGGLRRPGLVVVSCWLAELLVASPGRTRLYRRAYEAVDRLVYFSSNQTGIFRQRLGVEPSRLRFVPFGIDHEAFTPCDGPDHGYVLAVGRDRGRDWRTFLAAMERCQLPAKVLCRPEDVAGLPTPSNVEVMGYVDVDTYRNLLGRARLSVIASHERAYPSGQTVLLESMAMGRTTVVTDTPALRDYVEPGVTALTVPTGDPVRLAEIMTTAFDDPALREGLGGAARHAVERTFNARRMWDDIGEIIDEVAH